MWEPQNTRAGGGVLEKTALVKEDAGREGGHEGTKLSPLTARGNF